MTKPSEPKITKAHKALAEYIQEHFPTKDAAARQAIIDGYPVDSMDEERQFEAVRQQMRKLSNGNVHQPSLKRAIWFQAHWGIKVEDWGADVD